jgi:hypothetical protein
MDPRIRHTSLSYWEIGNKRTSEALQKYYAEKYHQVGRGNYELE